MTTLLPIEREVLILGRIFTAANTPLSPSMGAALLRALERIEADEHGAGMGTIVTVQHGQLVRLADDLHTARCDGLPVRFAFDEGGIKAAVGTHAWSPALGDMT